MRPKSARLAHQLVQHKAATVEGASPPPSPLEYVVAPLSASAGTHPQPPPPPLSEVGKSSSPPQAPPLLTTAATATSTPPNGDAPVEEARVSIRCKNVNGGESPSNM